MARRTGTRVIGVVENMSGEVFGSGGGDTLAAEIGAPLLGRVPLDPVLRSCGDAGEPAVVAAPNSEAALALAGIAAAVARTHRHGPARVAKPLTVLS
jgi:ATP-binding protein involved in chromosome partitioning